MLVSHLYNFIFTKTSKTAGTSVEVYFEPYCLHEHIRSSREGNGMCVSDAGIIGQRGYQASRKKWYNHMSASKIRHQLGREAWNNYYKFTTIRNPFQKVVSAFHFEVKNAKKIIEHRQLLKFFFREWLMLGKLFNDRDRYIIDNEICLDYFIRYDQLHEGIEHVCDELGLPFEPERLPQLKSNHRPRKVDYAEYYELDTLALVAKHFSYEIRKFGFSIPELA